MTRMRSRSKRLMGTRSRRNLRSSIEEMPQGLNIKDRKRVTELAEDLQPGVEIEVLLSYSYFRQDDGRTSHRHWPCPRTQ
eukprot:scaffold886_cov174-Ochromonas_danica.AAC.18